MLLFFQYLGAVIDDYDTELVETRTLFSVHMRAKYESCGHQLLKDTCQICPSW